MLSEAAVEAGLRIFFLIMGLFNIDETVSTLVTYALIVNTLSIFST